MCIGIDSDRNEFMVARALATLRRQENAIFAQLDIDAAAAAALPEADIVLCLSVFHHWVRHLGAEPAIETLRAVASRAKRALVFETGQPEEEGARWTEALAFMKPDSDAWIRDFLATLGFAEVRYVGAFQTTVSPRPRNLYVALRA